MSKKLNKIVFFTGSILLAFVSGVMLVSSIILAFTPGLTVSAGLLANWGASAYIVFWAMIFVGALASVTVTENLVDSELLFKIVYYFWIPFPLFFHIYNTVFYDDWMAPVNDALRAWTGISFGGSPWTTVIVLWILYQIGKLGHQLLHDKEEAPYLISCFAVNCLIPLAFIPMLNFFGWAEQPPQFTTMMYFVFSTAIIVFYLMFRGKHGRKTLFRFGIFHGVFGILVIFLYAYLNSPAFEWLYDNVTNNPMFLLIIFLVFFLRSGSKEVGRSTTGNVITIYYAPVSGASGGGFGLIKWIIILFVIPAMFVGSAFSARVFFGNISASATDPAAARERGAMNVIRRQDGAIFMNGEKLEFNALTLNKAEIDGFIKSGVSYRMDGKIQYGYGNSGYPDTKFHTTVKMSYNAELDIYKFNFKSKEEHHGAFTREQLAPYYIADGAYYIVKENGVSYILYGNGGTKQAVEGSKNKNLYDFLMKHCITSSINTDFLISKKEALYDQNYLLRDGAYYYRYYNDSADGIYFTQHALRTYKNKPTQYIYMENSVKTHLYFNFTLDYYYDRIPTDAPSVADWK